MSSTVRAHLIIRGRVQKAGYRDYIDEVAFDLDLKGYVKNLPDRSVEVICEGEQEKIERFIDRIRIRQYPISVEDIEVDYSDATGEFRDFEIIREEDLTELCGKIDRHFYGKKLPGKDPSPFRFVLRPAKGAEII